MGSDGRRDMRESDSALKRISIPTGQIAAYWGRPACVPRMAENSMNVVSCSADWVGVDCRDVGRLRTLDTSADS